MLRTIRSSGVPMRSEKRRLVGFYSVANAKTDEEVEQTIKRITEDIQRVALELEAEKKELDRPEDEPQT